MQIKFRPLNKAGKVLEQLGYEISYMYDDLIFPDNPAVLFQYDDNTENGLIYHFNVDAENDFIDGFENIIGPICSKSGMIAIKGKLFKIIQKEGKEEIDLVFV